MQHHKEQGALLPNGNGNVHGNNDEDQGKGVSMAKTASSKARRPMLSWETRLHGTAMLLVHPLAIASIKSTTPSNREGSNATGFLTSFNFRSRQHGWMHSMNFCPESIHSRQIMSFVTSRSIKMRLKG